MIRHFVGVWLLYWTAVALLPVQSVYPATVMAALHQVTFVVSVLVAYVVAVAVLRVPRVPTGLDRNVPRSRSLIALSLWLSLVGLALLTYDKMYVQGIDYSEGVAVAREEWRQLGEEREGRASSIFSALGYLLGSSYYVAMALAVTQGRVLSARFRFWAIVASAGFVLANSLITGGRSSVLLFAVFFLGALTARREVTLESLLGTRPRVRALAALALVSAMYTVYVFYARAAASGVAALEYALEFLPFLGLEAQSWYRQTLDGGPVSSLGAMLVLAMSYVTHSFATVAAIVDATPEDKTILFLHLAGLLHKVGLGPLPDGEWFLAGRLPTVPGALLYQFGMAGPLAGGGTLGICCATARAWTTSRPDRVLPLGAFTLAHATLVLSPAVLALDFLSAPFIAASFFMLAVVERFADRRRRTASTTRRPNGNQAAPYRSV